MVDAVACSKLEKKIAIIVLAGCPLADAARTHKIETDDVARIVRTMVDYAIESDEAAREAFSKVSSHPPMSLLREYSSVLIPAIEAL